MPRRSRRPGPSAGRTPPTDPRRWRRASPTPGRLALSHFWPISTASTVLTAWISWISWIAMSQVGVELGLSARGCPGGAVRRRPGPRQKRRGTRALCPRRLNAGDHRLFEGRVEAAPGLLGPSPGRSGPAAGSPAFPYPSRSGNLRSGTVACPKGEAGFGQVGGGAISRRHIKWRSSDVSSRG